MKKMIFSLAIVMIASVAIGQRVDRCVDVVKVGLITGVNHFTDRSEFAKWGCTTPQTMAVRGLTVTAARRWNNYWLSDPGDWGWEYGVTGTIGYSEYQGSKSLFLGAKPYLHLVMVPFRNVKYGYSIGVPITMAATKATIGGKVLGATPLSISGGCFAQYGKLSIGLEMSMHEDFKTYIRFEF